jgi:hypothetical protein
MNLKSVKKIDDVKLAGIELDWIKEDGQCREVRLTDKSGFILVIRADGGYGSTLKVLRLAPESEKADQDFGS